MKAAVYRSYGPPDVVGVEDVPAPSPGDDEVLVRVVASSVNDFDWHLLTGVPFVNRAAAGFLRPRLRVLGSDVAGRVEEVGPGVTLLKPGDEVYGDVSPHGFGAFAEYVTAPEKAFARKPSSLSFEQAAAAPQAGGLAVIGLRGRRGIRPGQRVLINGAGGGTGTFAVQIAKAFGAEVTAVDAEWKLEGLRALGADHLLDYAVDDFTANGQTYDVILDVAAHRPMSAYRRSLRPGGVCAVTGGSIPRVVQLMALGPVTSAFRSRKVGLPRWKPNDDADVSFLSRLMDRGAVSPLVDSVFDLGDIAEAFRRFGAQQHTGKIVLVL